MWHTNAGGPLGDILLCGVIGGIASEDEVLVACCGLQVNLRMHEDLKTSAIQVSTIDINLCICIGTHGVYGVGWLGLSGRLAWWLMFTLGFCVRPTVDFSVRWGTT